MFIGFDDSMKLKYIVKNVSIQIGKIKIICKFSEFISSLDHHLRLPSSMSGSHFALAKNADLTFGPRFRSVGKF